MKILIEHAISAQQRKKIKMLGWDNWVSSHICTAHETNYASDMLQWKKPVQQLWQF